MNMADSWEACSALLLAKRAAACCEQLDTLLKVQAAAVDPSLCLGAGQCLEQVVVQKTPLSECFSLNSTWDAM